MLCPKLIALAWLDFLLFRNILRRHKEFLAAALAKTKESKQYLYAVLKKAGYEYIPSYTNFVLFPIKTDGKLFTDEMMKRDVSVRFWKFNDKNWCRVSIGTMEEMKSFEEAFVQIA